MSVQRRYASFALGLVLSVVWGVHAIASPEGEAKSLREKWLRNVARVQSLDLTCTIEERPATGRATQAGIPSQERIKWHAGMKKLKWKRLQGEPLGFVVDGEKKVLRYMNGGATIYEREIHEKDLDAALTAYPSWLWRPEGLIPEKPASVREEADVLVLVTSSAHPRREIWLSREDGRLLKFTDTDATGKQVRVVECRDWEQREGVWLPGTLVETVTAKHNGLRRLIKFESFDINPSLGDDDFVLP